MDIYNGFLIKRLDSYSSHKNCKYYGVDGYIFPTFYPEDDIKTSELEYINNYIYHELDKADKNTDFVDACIDLDFLNKYITLCNQNKWQIEIILCQTTRREPRISIQSIDEAFQFLGFDYAYPGPDYYSCIYNEILYGKIKAFNNFNLNENGLFNTIEEVQKFVEKRNEYKKEGLKNIEYGEDGKDYIIYKLWRYKNNKSINLNVST